MNWFTIILSIVMFTLTVESIPQNKLDEHTNTLVFTANASKGDLVKCIEGCLESCRRL